MRDASVFSHLQSLNDPPHSIVDLLPFPVVLFNVSSEQVAAVNKAAAKILGIYSDSLVGRTLDSLLEADTDLTADPWRVILRPFFYESQIVRASVLNPSIRLIPPGEEATTLTGFIFWEMFWYSTHGMFQSTPEGRFQRVNPAFAKMLGYQSPQDLISAIQNMETDLYVDPHLRARYRSRLEVSEAIQGLEFEVYRKDKSRIWLSVHSRAVRDLTGQIIYYEGTATDMTDRKAAEAQLLALNQKLETQSIQLAYHVKELDQFSNILAHDLSAPLRMICSYLPKIESRCSGMLSAEDREFLKFITDGAAHMKSLISGLLRYAQTQVPPRLSRPASADECLKLAMLSLQDQITLAQAKVSAESLPEVLIDSAMLMDIFLNLIGNALKYSGVVPLLINIRARASEEFIIFSVEDNGRGIPPEQQERIFLLYQRGDAAATEEGSGIGLAVIKRIVTGYGGRVWVESDGKKGATFYFSLPAVVNGKIQPCTAPH